MRKVFNARVLAVAVALLFSAPAFAQNFVLSPAVSYREKKVETGSGTSKENETNIDGRIGYLLSSGLYLGGLYNTETVDSGGGITEKGTAYGPSLGYVSNGFNIIGTYHLSAKREYNSGSGKVTYDDGSGIQLDLGYYLNITPTVGLGPQLTWRSLEYKKVNANGVETSTDRKITEIRPMIAMFFLF